MTSTAESAASSSALVRFGGKPDDPLLRADIAKRELAQQALVDREKTDQSGEYRTEDSSGQAEKNKDVENELGAGVDLAAHNLLRRQEEETRECARTKHRLVRSLLCTRITIPSAGSVSNSVLRAVLRGDTDELVLASNRNRLKGAATALTADERKRTALHLAVGGKDVKMVRALMRWRQGLNRSLQDELESLDHRRDLFVQEATALLASSTSRNGEIANCSLRDVERFGEWLSEERQRLVRVTEMRCEECWRKVVTATDDKGRTPLHWAASVAKADDSLIQALLTTGRADLSARDASLGADTASLHGLKTHLRRRVSSAAQQHAASANVSDKARTSADGTINPAVFPKNEAFHRRTGRLRRGRQKGDTYERKREAKQNYRAGERARQDGGSAKGPYGMTAGVAKVKWFCGALATTAEKLSGSGTRRKDREEAFLLNVFEDFDRSGNGTLSMREFHEALRDMNVRVSEPTLLEIGRYFQAPTLKDRRNYRAHHHRLDQDCQHRNIVGDSIDSAGIEISYAPLMDVVFGRKVVRETRRGSSSQGVNDDRRSDDEQEEAHETRGKATSERRRQPCDAKDESEREEHSDNSDRSYVDVTRIRAVRHSVLEARDALGRPPLFLAAAAGAVSAAKALIRHGASSTLGIDGTGLTAHTVSPSLFMRKIFAAEARKSLDQAIYGRSASNHHYSATEAAGGPDDKEAIQESAGVDTALDGDIETFTGLTRKMEMWVSTLSEGELASTRASEARMDQKTSLYLAAAAGLPSSVKDLMQRGVRETDEMWPARPAWTTFWQSPTAKQDSRVSAATQGAHGQGVAAKGSMNTLSLKTDASGWSPLHACCTESSPQHYYCALHLLGSSSNANPRTNTGKTPLHVAACVEGVAGGRGGGDLIPLLVSHGADLEAEDDDGLRPIHLAAKAGRHVALLALLSAGADLYSVTPRKRNALHHSVAGRHGDATRLLAYWDSDSGGLGRQRNAAGATPIDLGSTDDVLSATPTIWEAAARGDAGRVSRACTESSRCPKTEGATTGSSKPWARPVVNDKTPGLGFTPLHACMAGLAAFTRGLDVSPPCSPPRPRGLQQESGGAHFSVCTRQPSLFSRLVRERRLRGAKTARSSRGELGDRTTQTRNTSGPATLQQVDGGTAAFHTHGNNDHLAVCRTLLSAAVDVNALDARCRAPLALAAASGSAEAVEMLLGAGADPNAADADGNTPTHFALAYANAAIAAVLAKEGADPDARNGEGNTPQDVAGLCADLAAAPSAGGGEGYSDEGKNDD